MKKQISHINPCQVINLPKSTESPLEPAAPQGWRHLREKFCAAQNDHSFHVIHWFNVFDCEVVRLLLRAVRSWTLIADSQPQPHLFLTLNPDFQPVRLVCDSTTPQIYNSFTELPNGQRVQSWRHLHFTRFSGSGRTGCTGVELITFCGELTGGCRSLE